MNNKIKQWYEKMTQNTTIEKEWSQETIELGKEELDPKLIPKEEMAALNGNLLVNFYARDDDVVYTFTSAYREKQLLICLLRNGKLENSDYWRIDDDR